MKLQTNTKGLIIVSMTDNEASVIDEGTFSVRRTIRIAAPIEKVWTAVTEPEHISRWFGRTVLDGDGRRRDRHDHVPRVRLGTDSRRAIGCPAHGVVPLGQR